MTTSTLPKVRFFDPAKLRRHANYDPAALLEVLRDKFGAKNDAALCTHLGVTPPQISKIRNKVQPVSSTLLLRMHMATGMAVDELRRVMGDNT